MVKVSLQQMKAHGTMTKRLKAVNVPSTSENRLLFRETLFSSKSMKNCIGGVILYDETIKQTTNSKKTIPELISSSGASTWNKSRYWCKSFSRFT